MKTRVLIIFALIMIPIITESYAENSQEYTEAKLEWSQHNFGIINGTGTAKIILTDFDIPNIPSYIDRVSVFVYSDSFPEGITLILYETEKNSGIFERTFSFSDTRSAPNVLFAREGDTAITTYTDNTLPENHIFSEIHMMETTLIGLLGHPLERVPASNARITNLDGNHLNFPIVGEQVLLKSEIANGNDKEEKFVFIAQTIDDQRRIVSLSWIDGTINPQSSFDISTSWIPQESGDYTTTFFVWESLTNPSALSPPIEIEFTVLNEKDEMIFPEIRQNDMYCWTQWYLENTTIDEKKLILSIQNTISDFGSHVDVPGREITISHNEEETIISVAGVWTNGQSQHEELTSVIKNHIGDSKIIRDDIISCE